MLHGRWPMFSRTKLPSSLPAFVRTPLSLIAPLVILRHKLLHANVLALQFVKHARERLRRLHRLRHNRRRTRDTE